MLLLSSPVWGVVFGVAGVLLVGIIIALVRKKPSGADAGPEEDEGA
jgi:hypothetical protein